MELEALGIPCGKHRVARLMRAEGLKAKSTPSFRVTTQSGHASRSRPTCSIASCWRRCAWHSAIAGHAGGSTIPSGASRVDSIGRRDTSPGGVAMAGRRRSARSTRATLRSPGRPPVGRREDRQRFWAAIARGCYAEAAVVDALVSWVVGARWSRQAGGMPPTHLAPSAPPLSGRYLSFAEHEQLALLRAQGARRARDRPSARARAVDHLARAPPQCGDSQRRVRVPGEHGAVACRPRSASSQASHASDAAAAAAVCARATGGRDRRPEWDVDPRTCGAVEGPSARTTPTSAMGSGLES
jgi:hypothetical protein